MTRSQAHSVSAAALLTVGALGMISPPTSSQTRPEASVMGLWSLSEGTGKAYPGGS